MPPEGGTTGGTIAIFGERPDWHTPRLVAAFRRLGLRCVCLPLAACGFAVCPGSPSGLVLPGFGGGLPAGVFVRSVCRGSFEQVTARLGILHALRGLGVPVCNDARAIERCVDKSMTSFLLGRAGIPTPETWSVEDPAAARAILDRAGGDLVLKPLFGAQGRGLRRLSPGAPLPDPEEVGGVYYLQRYVASDAGWRDWRVFVVGGQAAGGRAVAAMIRHGRSWITNVHQGARCEAAPNDGEPAALAVAAARAVAADHAGVDVIRDRDGRFQVLEVNSMPAWKGLQGVTEIDIAAELAADFAARLPVRAGQIL